MSVTQFRFVKFHPVINISFLTDIHILHRNISRCIESRQLQSSYQLISDAGTVVSTADLSIMIKIRQKDLFVCLQLRNLIK